MDTPPTNITDTTIEKDSSTQPPAQPSDSTAPPIPVPESDPALTPTSEVDNPPKDVGNPQPEPRALSDGASPPTESFLEKLYAALQQFFYPGGGQYFALQFPGRFLQISQYAWDTKSAGIYGQFVKPVAVNESEFRLTDQLYDVAEVVGGPNGVNLSIVYDQILNNLLPIFQDTGLGKQQNEIRKWLLREVKISPWIQKLLDAQQKLSGLTAGADAVDGASFTLRDGAQFAVSNKASQTNTVNRLELSNALLQEYLQAKQAWELERSQMIEEALELRLGTEESTKALNKLTRRLAHITALRQSQLASKWADVVVRGYYHNIREYMGYMDIKSSSEFLQDAKDSFREASMSSLDGALKVYPVQMSPIDWFEALSTSFTMEDLTQDPTLLEQQINAKSRQLDVLNAQMASLLGGSKGNLQELESKLSGARSTLDQAQAKLTSSYTNNIINMVKTCVTAAGQLSRPQMNEVLGQGGLGLATSVLDSLQQDFQSVLNAQNEVVTASRVYTQALDAWALAQATDTQQQQELIRLQTATLQKELDELVGRYQMLNKMAERPTAPAEDDGNIDDIDLFPPVSTSGGSRWQEIRMSQTIKSNYTKSQDYSYASVRDSSCNLWLWSSASSSEFATGGSEFDASNQEDKIELGFRATLVTVDRAGWFQPQFFKQSQSYYHVNSDAKWTRYPAGINSPEEIKAQGARAYAELNRGRLPAFPVGYVICKDITIKIAYDESTDQVKKDFMKKSSTRSSGVLAFSTSSSTAESKSSNEHSFQSFSNGCVIRIPGPQLLGYIMQLTDNDETEQMPRVLPKDFFIPDSDYDSTIGADTFNAMRSEPPPKVSLFDQVENILRDNNVRESAIKDALGSMKKEFDDLSGDMSARIGTEMKL